MNPWKTSRGINHMGKIKRWIYNYKNMFCIKFDKDYRLGLRAIKTAVAVGICALISMFFNHEDIFCACIASVICMEQTCEQTIETGVNRFIGTMIGGIVGYVALESACMFSCYEWIRVFILPLCILMVVYACNIIGRKPAVSIGCVVVIVILSRSGQSTSSTLIYVFQRVCDTLLGVGVAMAVNKFMFQKKPKCV